MKKLQIKKSTFSNQLSYCCGLEKATPELATRPAHTVEDHFRNSSCGYQCVTVKCYAKPACKYVAFGKGLCLPDGFGKENAQGYAMAQSHHAIELVTWGMVPGGYRFAEALLKSNLL
jgi:hypothetical protein